MSVESGSAHNHGMRHSISGVKSEAGMKYKVVISLALSLAMLSVSTISGCLGGVNRQLVNLAKIVPGEATGFLSWNLEALGADRDMYKTVWKAWESEESKWLGDMVGVAAGEVKTFARASVPDLGVVTIVNADFISEDVEKKLEDNGYAAGSYLGVSVLTKAEAGQSVAVAVYDDNLVIGSKRLVEKCVDVVTGREGSRSLYEDSSMKGIVNRLPGGVVTGVERNRVLYDDLDGAGMSVVKEDEETLKVKAVYKFEVSGAASNQDTLTRIKDDLARIELMVMRGMCFDTEADAHDEFIHGTASMHIADFSYFDLTP